MSDTDSDADSLSDGSNSHNDDDDEDEDDGCRELCDRVRANDPRILNHHHVFELISYIGDSEAECIAVFQALKENTSVKHIDFSMLFEQNNYTVRSTLVAAEYLESSKTLQTLDLGHGRYQYPREVGETISLLLRALSRNTTVDKVIIHPDGFRFASVAFQELLTSTQTLQTLQSNGYGNEVFSFSGVQIAAITSGFANNTTLRNLTFDGWQEAELAAVLTALHCHPALQKIHFSGKFRNYLPSLSGLEVLLRSQDSKVKELILEQVDTDTTVGLHPVLQELGRNTTVTDLSIRYSALTRENVQQVKFMLRQNTTLQFLDLKSSGLGSTGLAELSLGLYRNTSIKTLDLSRNGLDDIESAYVLHELLRHNKTITDICLAENDFGRNAAAARSILEGLRSNTALQQLDLSYCGLGDHGMSLLANALAIRNASMLVLNLYNNQITSVGVRVLVDDNVEAVKTLTKLCLTHNPVRSEGATIMADALGRNAMPSLKQLDLCGCGIDDVGIVALVSALEQNTSLQSLKLTRNQFGKRGFMALAESLPNIKELQEIRFMANAGFQSTLPLLLEGFRKNTSLVEVAIAQYAYYEPVEWKRELKFLGQRNRFIPLLKASDPEDASPQKDASPQLGIWSRALAKVGTEPDVLFHVLRNKPILVGSAGGSKKRKRNEE
jgi:Ran GTPase-activating protein (RanGAP) involved in mRNA processing and transport